MNKAEVLWSKLDKARLLTGAWQGISLSEVPTEVRLTFITILIDCGYVIKQELSGEID